METNEQKVITFEDLARFLDNLKGIMVKGTGVKKIVRISEVDYNNLASKDKDTLYIVE